MFSGLISRLTVAVQALWRSFVGLSALASGIMLPGGTSVSRRRENGMAPRRPAPIVLDPPPMAVGHFDLDLELRIILSSLESDASLLGCTLELAVEPGLVVRADCSTVRQATTLAVANALARASGGRVLVAAGRHGGRLQISVVDDAEPTERPMIEAALRPAAQVCAMQGGTLEVHTIPGSGTRVLIRFPDPSEGRSAPQPVSVALQRGTADIAHSAGRLKPDRLAPTGT